MAYKYRVLQKIFAGTPPRVYQPGETIELSEPGNPDQVQPIDGAPMAPRRYDVPGSAGLSIDKRAELAATRRPLKN